MDALEGDFQIPMTENVSTEVTEMCNWSKGVKEAAMEKGLQQGLEKRLCKGSRGRSCGRQAGQYAENFSDASFERHEV